MSLITAGAYLEEVRLRRRITRQQLAPIVGVSPDRIEDAEKGRSRLNGPALLRLIQAIAANYEHVTELLDDESRSVEEARALARHWVERPADDLDTEVAELFEIALARTNGDAAAARQLLLRAIEQTLPSADK